MSVKNTWPLIGQSLCICSKETALQSMNNKRYSEIWVEQLKKIQNKSHEQCTDKMAEVTNQSMSV